jgi:CHAD domain-containing protein
MTDRDQLKRAAAAAGVAGAALAAGKAGIDALRDGGGGGDGDGSGRSRSYSLEHKESLGDGLRRIASGRAEHALEQLRDEDGDRATAVHEARKDLKKIRTVLRLSREALGDELYRAENSRFRDAGRRLSAARDAQVRLDTLAKLRERLEDESVVAGRLDRLRDRLSSERELAAEAEEAGAAEAVAEIEAGHEEIGRWPLEGDDWGLIELGLERAYRRGRNRFRDAAGEPSVENLHEWRKRVKDLWYALRILAPAWPDVAEPLADEAHRLSDLLGDDHDFAVLAAAARERPEAFGDPADLDAALDAIGERRSELQNEAFVLGRRVYADKPGAFVRRLESWWRAWRAEAGVAVTAG